MLAQGQEPAVVLFHVETLAVEEQLATAVVEQLGKSAVVAMCVAAQLEAAAVGVQLEKAVVEAQLEMVVVKAHLDLAVLVSMELEEAAVVSMQLEEAAVMAMQLEVAAAVEAVNVVQVLLKLQLHYLLMASAASAVFILSTALLKRTKYEGSFLPILQVLMQNHAATLERDLSLFRHLAPAASPNPTKPGTLPTSTFREMWRTISSTVSPGHLGSLTHPVRTNSSSSATPTSSSTPTSYLSAMSSLHANKGFPSISSSHPVLLQRSLRSLNRCHQSLSGLPRLAITHNVLQLLVAACDPHHPNSAIFATVWCTAYFGLLCSANIPLFSLPSSRPFTCEILVNSIHSLLPAINKNLAHYTGHSFRIGGGTAAANLGYTEYEIQVLGQWCLDAYMTYLRINMERCATLATTLLTSS
ncbi:hypothetical protein HDU77_009488 [Chytriomyces hyalinus]|nr:hypothetical protein HDU77_009488 [Chytriomyces hyalinus]